MTSSHDLLDATATTPLNESGAITIDDTAVRRNGQPWFPVMGEYHFSRDEPERWLHELQAMRAGGITVVATYLIWILHEEERGSRSFADHLDVRRFVQDARRAGLEVMLRIGPWAHGEARNGGFPDWLQALPVSHRTNDPAYLEIVDGWYRDVASELRGLFRDDEHPDAPIIGIQVDNELYDQPDHLATLRDMAEAAGMVAPLWVATGWGGAQLPLDRVAPVYAGYSDAFWESTDIDWPSYAQMHFEYSTVRDDLSVGADVRGELLSEPVPEDHRYAFLTCELGGGMATAYHRRPLVDPEDVAALGITKIGSGSAWQGYYLYHGTTQVTGSRGGTQESHETDYPNDMPRKDYDFYAPIGAAGTLRPHYHLLRRQHLFLNTWGGALTQLPVILPERAAGDLRWSLRADAASGYVFVTNHQPAVRPLPQVDDVRFTLDIGTERVTVPAEPISVPAGAAFFWPIRQSYGDIAALTATAQPVTEIVDGTTTFVFLTVLPGIPVELQIESDHPIRGATAVDTAAGRHWVPDSPAGPACVVTVGDTRLVILDDTTSRHLWVAELDGRRTAIVFNGGLLQTADGVRLERWNASDEVLLLPARAGHGGETIGSFQRLELPAWQHETRLDVAPIRTESAPAPLRGGGSMNRLSAPVDADFDESAVFEIPIDLPPNDDGALVLSLEWTGDVARAEIDGVLIADQFWSGRTWEIELGTWRSALDTGVLRIRVLPWDGTSDVFVDGRVRHRRRALVATVDSARLRRSHRASLTA
ncbi:beta-galactosidase [Microbacteriaceae bacterium VKM Ac-2855]|nr:beta-galactosidase [Microbacteriaceae bacterium VKM Ac-2855]